MPRTPPYSMDHAIPYKKPKSILKNQTAQHVSPTTSLSELTTSTTSTTSTTNNNNGSTETKRRETLQNTNANATKYLSTPNAASTSQDSRSLSPRLKWDEANLYLTEQEKSSTMKITEPKTPFAPKYDPREDVDEEEDGDERQGPNRSSTMLSDDIPSLDIGEPEEAIPQPPAADEDLHRRGVEKQVVVEEAADHMNEPPPFTNEEEEEEKHRKFAELRKKHYEMKGALGLPSVSIPEDDEEKENDEDVDMVNGN